jgi:predicted nucleic acid-binding protein
VGTRGIIDTNLVIDFLNGVPQALSLIQSQPERAISIITWIEVVAGFRTHDPALQLRFARNFPILPLTEAIAAEAAKLRQSTRLKLPDAVILATARVHGRTLFTRNTRDFSAGVDIVIPYVL